MHMSGLSSTFCRLHCQKVLKMILRSVQEPTRQTKSSIKKAKQLARSERKKRQKFEAREKAKSGLSGEEEPATPADHGASLVDEPTSESEDQFPSTLPDIPRPVPPIPHVPADVPSAAAAAVSSDTTALSTMPLTGVSRPPLEPRVNNEPVLSTDATDVISTIPRPESVAKIEPSANKGSSSETEIVKKRQNVLNRVVYSLVMIGVFIGGYPVLFS